MHLALRRRPFPLCLSLLALSALPACSGSDGSPKVEEFKGDCSTLESVPTYEELRSGVLTYCVRCHSASLVGPARNGAPDTMNFDTYEGAQRAGIYAVPFVQQQRMPPSGEKPGTAERNQYLEWAICGMPP